MAVLLCGGAGYIGSHVNQYLASKGIDTIVLDNLVYGHREAVGQEIFIKGDLANPPEIRQVFEEYPIEAVLHFAAYAYVGESVADPDGRIGESHTPETHLIPLVLKAASGERGTVKVFGTDYDTPDGSCIRDYIHVCDLAQAHYLALKYLLDGVRSTCYNLGDETGSSVLELIHKAQEVTGREIKVELAERRPGDPAILVGSGEKIRKELGWEPKYPSIKDILAHAWNWEQNKRY